MPQQIAFTDDDAATAELRKFSNGDKAFAERLTGEYREFRELGNDPRESFKLTIRQYQIFDEIEL
jgi:hypothetical protein